MKIKIEIDCDNEDFGTTEQECRQELLRLLCGLGRRIAVDGLPKEKVWYSLRDSKNKPIGRCSAEH